ncbi:cupin domain-containing protein [Mycobacterium palustre]|uniref:Cupin n=1 Tax=Mycobacterium palustre TaxID=153971 RepID=A0A1X1Z8D8_9MYCO|nr:cupin domain-containing protein [Mycobacterium palustre]MCV7099419.1 cupin domain-containing protein [Mycobacterium palustre]ORW19596.1 cupin [Mycobacterium palustre]
MSLANATQSLIPDLDPTVPAPPTNVAERGFEGRLDDWADWEGSARYFEYSKAANPIGSGHAPQVPVRRFGPELYLDAPTGAVALDLSDDLGLATGPATSPALLASFVRIRAGEHVDTNPNATSQLFYVLYGRGHADVDGRPMAWEKGDFVTLPAATRSAFYADADAALYWVHDEPLLRYLGVEATRPRFCPTKFRRADAVAKLEEIAARPGANEKSRVSVLLANAEQEQTLTITHVLWAMFGVLPPHQEQRPHRHQSVALDLILDAPPHGCYTLLGTRLDERGDIVDPIRVDWQAGGAFTTPPGMWHAHYNESDEPAHLIPVQDAGLHTHLRSLDIKFTQRRG